MAFLGQSYSTETLPESTGFDPIPAGNYTALITGAELVATKSGSGQYIKIEWTVTGPKHANKKVWQNINIKNANPKAEEIARQQLGEVMRASGLATVQDTDQLITGRDLEVKISIRKSEEYGDSNEIKGVKALSGAMPQQVPQVTQAQPTPQPQAGNSPPWAQNK